MSPSGNARVLGGIILRQQIQQFADLSAGFGSEQSIKDWLSTVLAICLSRDLKNDTPLFSEWGALSVFQGGMQISLASKCAALRTDTPVVCVIDRDGSLPVGIVASFLVDKWDEENKEKEAERLAKRVADRISALVQPLGQVVPTSQERHWLTTPAVIGLKRFFHGASDEIARKLKSNPTRREEGLTDELVYEIFSNPGSRELLRDLLAPSGVLLEMSCEESGSAEKVLGTDLGFVLTIRAPGLFTRRAILLQAKRLHPAPDDFTPRSEYGDLLEKHGREQAQKMLQVTSSAFFLLYNPLGLEATVPRSGMLIEIPTSLDYSTDGITVLPASIVCGMDRLAWSPVAHLHPFTCSFVKFIVDDFIQGKVGDQSQRALQAALTRKLRRTYEVGENNDVPPPRFTISLELDVSHMAHFRHIE